MALTPSQVSELKKQLHEQVSHLPQDQRKQADEQIENMSSESLEIMLNQQRSNNQKQSNKSIFRSIIDNEIDSVLVQDTSNAKAVLDIAPIAKGHTLIIPKKLVTDARQLPVSIFSLAKEIATRMTSKLMAKSTVIQTEIKFGEAVVHVIPSYSDVSLDLSSSRSKSTKEELDKVALDLRPKPKKQKPIVIKKQPAKDEGKSSALKLRRRVP